MILSTTEKIENREVEKYLGLVFAEQVNGIDFIRDIGASLRNFVGGRSSGYEEEIIKMRDECLKELCQRAEAMGADAVVALKFNFQSMGSNGGMFFLNISGTAVKLK